MKLSSTIFKIPDRQSFEKMALLIFHYQYDHNPVYHNFCSLLKKDKTTVKKMSDIPFLPISFFKSHSILSSKSPIEITFTSSGTTGTTNSHHFVTDLSLYQKSYHKGFFHFYNAIKDYVVLALLPSYLEREGSSLIYMVDDLIRQTHNPDSGFYLDNYDQLIEKLLFLDRSGKKIILIGVTYALLDLLERHAHKTSWHEKLQLQNTIIMETGGMKGRRKEMIREELHNLLCEGFGVSEIHSEYGMTELLSQAYSRGHGLFECPPWMDVLIRDPQDSLSLMEYGKTGGINVIDLANINSCSFIATEDLGKKQPNNSFEILGRFDHSDIRGCNLMLSL